MRARDAAERLAQHRGRRLEDRRAPVRGRRALGVRVRRRQRLPRRPRRARGGRAGARPRRDPQRLPRDVADRLPRGRLRPRAHRADDRQRAPTARSSACSSTTSRSTSPPRAIVRYERVLDMRTGVLSREVEFETARGAADARPLAPSRLARRPPPGRDRLRGDALDGRSRVAISLGARHARSASRPPTTRAAARASPRRCSCRSRRAPTARAPSCSSPPATAGSSSRAGSSTASTRRGRAVERDAPTATARGSSCSADLEPGEPLRLSKFVAYHWAPQAPAGDLVARVDRTLDRAARDGYDAVERAHRRHVDGLLAAQRRRGRGRARASSRPSASTCSSCCRRPRAARASAWPPRASPAAATRATTSGTPRSTSSRS